MRFEASDDAASKAKSVYDNLVPMVADDIADQIIYAATRPAHDHLAQHTNGEQREVSNALDHRQHGSAEPVDWCAGGP